MMVRMSRGVVDLWLGDVDVMDLGGSSWCWCCGASSAVGFWNLDQLGRCLHSETLLGSHFLASCCGDVKALRLVLLRANRFICVEANILGLSLAEPVGEGAESPSSVAAAGDVEAYVLSLRSATLSFVYGQTLPSGNLPAVVDCLAFTLLHGNHFGHLDAPCVGLHRTLLAVDGVTLGAWASAVAGWLRHKVANFLVSTVPVDKLALLHLVHVAVAGAVTLEAHLVLNHATLWLLEVNALLLDLHGDGGLAHGDGLWDALDLADVGTNLFTLGRAAPLSLHGATLLVGPIPTAERAGGCKIRVNTGRLISLDADFLLLDLTAGLNIVSTLGLGGGAALALRDVDTDLLLTTGAVKQAVGGTRVTAIGALQLVGNCTATTTAPTRITTSRSTSSTISSTTATSATIQGDDRVTKGCVKVDIATITSHKTCSSPSSSKMGVTSKTSNASDAPKGWNGMCVTSNASDAPKVWNELCLTSKTSNASKGNAVC